MIRFSFAPDCLIICKIMSIVNIEVPGAGPRNNNQAIFSNQLSYLLLNWLSSLVRLELKVLLGLNFFSFTFFIAVMINWLSIFNLYQHFIVWRVLFICWFSDYLFLPFVFNFV